MILVTPPKIGFLDVSDDFKQKKKITTLRKNLDKLYFIFFLDVGFEDEANRIT